MEMEFMYRLLRNDELKVQR